jgi:hypothetical protein
VGLDVYVGTLTRYHGGGEWETVVERLAREEGLEFEVIRADGNGDGETADPAEVAEAVLAWREALAAGLGQPLDWREDDAAPYFTDKPAWDGYGSLQVLAASVERGERKRPSTGVDEWHRNRTWRKATKRGPRFAHIYFPELWLPVDLPATFEAEDVLGNRVPMGSSVRLLADLRAVNDASYAGSGPDLSRWRTDGAEYGGPFDDAARFGLAVFLELAERSVEERLPMRLDY